MKPMLTWVLLRFKTLDEAMQPYVVSLLLGVIASGSMVRFDWLFAIKCVI